MSYRSISHFVQHKLRKFHFPESGTNGMIRAKIDALTVPTALHITYNANAEKT